MLSERCSWRGCEDPPSPSSRSGYCLEHERAASLLTADRGGLRIEVAPTVEEMRSPTANIACPHCGFHVCCCRRVDVTNRSDRAVTVTGLFVDEHGRPIDESVEEWFDPFSPAEPTPTPVATMTFGSPPGEVLWGERRANRIVLSSVRLLAPYYEARSEQYAPRQDERLLGVRFVVRLDDCVLDNIQLEARIGPRVPFEQGAVPLRSLHGLPIPDEVRDLKPGMAVDLHLFGGPADVDVALLLQRV